ncbi:MAG: hypothetical protein RLZZ322_1884 [Verrucomicrobiota bacterium]
MSLYDRSARGRAGEPGHRILTMSYDRRDFLKTLALGGFALFTPDWFGSVKERRPRQPEFRLPAYPGDPIPDNHDVINAVWNTGTGYILYLNGTPYGDPPKITLREKLAEEGEEGVGEVIDAFRSKYGRFIWDLEDLEQDVEAEQIEELNKGADLAYTFEEGETWRDFINRHDWQLLEDVESSVEEWGTKVFDRLDDDIDWDEHEDWLTDWCRNQAPEADALGYVEGLFDRLEEEGEEQPDLHGQLDAYDLDAIYFIDGACPGNDTLRCAVAPDYETLAALQRAIDGLGWSATVVLLEPDKGDEKPDKQGQGA